MLYKLALHKDEHKLADTFNPMKIKERIITDNQIHNLLTSITYSTQKPSIIPLIFYYVTPIPSMSPCMRYVRPSMFPHPCFLTRPSPCSLFAFSLQRGGYQQDSKSLSQSLSKNNVHPICHILDKQAIKKLTV